MEVSILSTVKDLKLKAFAAFNLDAAVLSDSVFVKTGDGNYKMFCAFSC